MDQNFRDFRIFPKMYQQISQKNPDVLAKSEASNSGYPSFHWKVLLCRRAEVGPQGRGSGHIGAITWEPRTTEVTSSSVLNQCLLFFFDPFNQVT